MGTSWKLLALLLLATPAMADDLKNELSGELCVQLSVALMTNSPHAELVDELHSRGETCAPGRIYMEAAAQRLGYQQQPSAEQLAEERRERSAARIRVAGRAYLQMQAQQPAPQSTMPINTTCRQTTVGTQCTTWP